MDSIQHLAASLNLAHVSVQDDVGQETFTKVEWSSGGILMIDFKTVNWQSDLAQDPELMASGLICCLAAFLLRPQIIKPRFAVSRFPGGDLRSKTPRGMSRSPPPSCLVNSFKDGAQEAFHDGGSRSRSLEKLSRQSPAVAGFFAGQCGYGSSINIGTWFPG